MKLFFESVLTETAYSAGIKFLKNKMLNFVDGNAYYCLYNGGSIASKNWVFGPFSTKEAAKEKTKRYRGKPNSYYRETARTMSGTQLLSMCTSKLYFEGNKVFDPLSYIDNKDWFDALMFFGYSRSEEENKAKELGSSRYDESKKRINESIDGKRNLLFGIDADIRDSMNNDGLSVEDVIDVLRQVIRLDYLQKYDDVTERRLPINLKF